MSGPFALTLVTATLPGRAGLLGEAAASVDEVRGLLGRSGLAVEWRVCVDGAFDAAVAELFEARAHPDDSLLQLGRHCGVAAARNLAATDASGACLMPLDADDLLVPEGVVYALELLGRHPGHGWVGGASRILRDGPVGSEAHRSAESSNLVRSDGLLAHPVGSVRYVRPWPFHPNVLVFRTPLLFAVGGWPAVPAAEDKGLSVRLSQVSPGLQTDRELIRYRLWDGQATASDGFDRLDVLSERFNLRCVDASGGEG